jgi:hypothetical protein
MLNGGRRVVEGEIMVEIAVGCGKYIACSSIDHVDNLFA